MTAPVTFNVNSDQLRGLGSAWTRLGDAIENLDPGGAITSRAGSHRNLESDDVSDQHRPIPAQFGRRPVADRLLGGNCGNPVVRVRVSSAASRARAQPNHH